MKDAFFDSLKTIVETYKEKRDQSSAKFIIIGTIIAFSISLILAWIFSIPNPALIISIEILILIIAFSLNKYLPNYVIVFFVSISFIFFTWSVSYLGGYGIRDISVLSYPLIIVFGGLYLKRKHYSVLCFIAMLMFTLFGILELYGFFKTELSDYLTYRTLLNANITLLVTAIAVGYLSNQYRKVLEQVTFDKAELSLTNQRLNSLINSTPLATILIDSRDKVLLWNPAAEKMFGWKSQEIIENRLPILPDEFLSTYQDIKEKINETNNNISVEHALLQKDGNSILSNTSITKLNRTPDKEDNYLLISEDISVNKKNEQEIINSRNRAVAMAEASFEGISIITDGLITGHNQQLLQMLNYDGDDLLNKNFLDFISPRYKEIVYNAIQNNYQDPYEIELIRKDGSYINVEVRGRMMEVDGKKVRLSAIRDITQAKLDSLKHKILFNIANATVTSGNIDELFEIIEENLELLIPVENFYIALYNKETDIISFPYFRDSVDPVPESRKPGKGLTEYIIRTGKPIIATIKFLEELHQKGEIKFNRSQIFYERLAVPLIHKGDVIGVFAIKNYDSKNRLDKNALDLMVYTSNQIATALAKKLSEERLSVQLKFFNLLMEYFPDAIYLKDKESRFISVSKSFAQKAGFSSPKEIIGKTDLDFFNKKHALKAFNDEQDIIRTGIPLVGEEEKEIWPNGKETYVITTKMPWFDPNGNIVGTFGIAHDITLRKNAEMERDRFFNISLDLLCVAGTDGYLKRINPAFEKTLGFTANELLTKPFIDFVHDEDKKSTINSIKQLSDQKPIINFENRYLCKDGSYKWLSWISAPHGELIYAAAHDITERKKFEISLLKSEKRLKEINATKDKFFSIIAHDLRSPYQGLIGLLDFIINYFETLTTSEILSNIETLNKIVHNQFALLEDLLQWGRLQSGTSKFRPRKNNLSEVVRESVLFLNSSIMNKHLNIEYNILDDCLLEFDYNMISVVLRNLLSNAIKFSHPGGKIEIVIHDEDINVILSIRDYGIGIKNDLKEKLFKIENTFSTYGTENETGSGLGLILCNEIIKKHNGRIKVESIEKKGSTFTIILNKNFSIGEG